MMLDTGFLAVFLVGFLGGGHCVGMCGGLTAALALQLPKQSAWRYLLLANFARIFSYSLAGAAVGAMAEIGIFNISGVDLKLILYILANLMIFAMGLYLAQFSSMITQIEALGRPIWRILQPKFRQFLPIRTPFGAIAAGAIWGWLPCGLVYTALMSAMLSGSAQNGALTMFAFGLGTLPNVFLLGIFALPLKKMLQNIWLRRAMGLSLSAWAIWAIFGALKTL